MPECFFIYVNPCGIFPLFGVLFSIEVFREVFMDRKYFIDNLRVMMILLLFPFHAALPFDGGEFGGFFVWIHRNAVLHAFVTFVYPWFMSLLFVLAGISAHFSLRKRSPAAFFLERTKKLLLPLVLGLLFLVPVQSYVADLYFNGYQGSYFSHLAVFFTRFTDFTGYDGTFTPSHLWFILYLYPFSLLLLLFTRLPLGKYRLCRLYLPYPLLLLLFLPEYLFLPVLNITAKSVGQHFFLFLAGYLIFSREEELYEIMRGRKVSLVLFLISGTLYTMLWCGYSYAGAWMPLLYLFFGWCGILTFTGYGMKYMNRRTCLSSFFSRISFSLYLFHMPVEVVTLYMLAKITRADSVLFILTALISFLCTLFMCIMYGFITGKLRLSVRKAKKKW